MRDGLKLLLLPMYLDPQKGGFFRVLIFASFNAAVMLGMVFAYTYVIHKGFILASGG